MKLVLDLKVNGVDFHKNSVLSFYGILFDGDNIIKIFNRYYFPREQFNHPTLDRISISEQRKQLKANYSNYFDDDKELKDLFLNENLEVIIGYNIMFNISFISKTFKIYKELENKQYFCTMLNNINLLQLPFEHLKNKDCFKFPTLKQVMTHHKVQKFYDNEENLKFYVDANKEIYFKTLKELKETNTKSLDKSELIYFYKSNLTDIVLSDYNFKEIFNKNYNENMVDYNSLSRKHKKIVDDYFAIKYNNYSIKKLEDLNNIISIITLDFTTKYPMSAF